MERKESCFHVITFVKLRSLDVRRASRDAVDSRLNHMVPHTFRTGMIAPTPTTKYRTSYKG
jgi:hypothetical protein